MSKVKILTVSGLANVLGIPAHRVYYAIERRKIKFDDSTGRCLFWPEHVEEAKKILCAQKPIKKRK
jgi:hypothetical protein